MILLRRVLNHAVRFLSWREDLIRVKVVVLLAGWLLVKMKDEAADARRRPASTEPESVLSGRTVEELSEEDGSG